MHVRTGSTHQKRNDTIATQIQQQQQQQHDQDEVQQLITKHVKRVYITQSRKNKTEHVIYIHCKTPEACSEMKQTMTSLTTLIPTATYDRYVVGNIIHIHNRH